MTQQPAASRAARAVGTRTVLVVAHTGREPAVRSARYVVDHLAAAGLAVRVLAGEAAEIARPAAQIAATSAAAVDGAELVVVIGGDGTLLRAAELARPAGLPLLGVNLGHVGFLAEADPEDLAEVVDQVAAGRCLVEERMTIDVTVRANGGVTATTWALNEATVEKSARERMVDVVVEVDGRPLSRWGCDGVVFATPTGSTAYSLSVGGPIVEPTLEMLLVSPISPHTLSNRPVVLRPESVVRITIEPGQQDAILTVDGQEGTPLAGGDVVVVRRGREPVLLVHSPDRTHYDVLRSKLGWGSLQGGGYAPRAARL